MINSFENLELGVRSWELGVNVQCTMYNVQIRTRETRRCVVGDGVLDRPFYAGCTALADDRGGRPYIGLSKPVFQAFILKIYVHYGKLCSQSY